MSPLSEKTLGDIFIAPVLASDIDEELSEKDLKYIQAFENAWEQFVMENPHHLPIGYQQADIKDLRSELIEVEKDIESVKQEMESQLEYFEQSRHELEEKHTENQYELFEARNKMEEDLCKKLDDIAHAEQLQNRTFAWTNFLRKLDSVIPQLNLNESDASTYSKWKESVSRPSDRALALSREVSGSLLHAYRVDYALLTTHITMLQKEIERLVSLQESTEMVGKFLTDYNAWSVINVSEDMFGPGEYIASMASTSPRNTKRK